jgi:hypothetical protein
VNATPLFARGDRLRVANVGTSIFLDSMRAAGADVVEVTWRPPVDGEPETATSTARLLGNVDVDVANQVAIAKALAVSPRIIDVRTARDVIGAFAHDRVLLHAGPPIAFVEMCGPMQGALIGAACLEGWAANPLAAEALLRAGDITVDSCHHHGAVGPMAGVVSPSMPLWVVADSQSDSRAYATMNEGLGKVLRFGANSPDVLDRLRWIASTVAPVLRDLLAASTDGSGGLDPMPIMAQALHMGDEVHNRNAAATGQLLKELTRRASKLRSSRGATSQTDRVHEVLAFIANNDHFFLNISMAVCKLRMDAARNVPCSSVVTAMARNGVRVGIRLSGTGDEWFQAPAERVQGLYFPGYGPADAAGDLGDSAITETAGLGGFAMAAAPAIVGFVGGTSSDAIATSQRMRTITVGVDPRFTLPTLGFAPIGFGIDARAVVDSGVLPVINTGIAHRDAGVGQIGAGVTTAPAMCFVQAIRRLDELLGAASDERAS